MMKYSMLFECGTMSTSCPPDIIHVIGVPRPFPFFAALPLLCKTQTKEHKWGRPGIHVLVFGMLLRLVVLKAILDNI